MSVDEMLTSTLVGAGPIVGATLASVLCVGSHAEFSPGLECLLVIILLSFHQFMKRSKRKHLTLAGYLHGRCEGNVNRVVRGCYLARAEVYWGEAQASDAEWKFLSLFFDYALTDVGPIVELDRGASLPKNLIAQIFLYAQYNARKRGDLQLARCLALKLEEHFEALTIGERLRAASSNCETRLVIGAFEEAFDRIEPHISMAMTDGMEINVLDRARVLLYGATACLHLNDCENVGQLELWVDKLIQLEQEDDFSKYFVNVQCYLFVQVLLSLGRHGEAADRAAAAVEFVKMRPMQPVGSAMAWLAEASCKLYELSDVINGRSASNAVIETLASEVADALDTAGRLFMQAEVQHFEVERCLALARLELLMGSRKKYIPSVEPLGRALDLVSEFGWSGYATVLMFELGCFYRQVGNEQDSRTCFKSASKLANQEGRWALVQRIRSEYHD